MLLAPLAVAAQTLQSQEHPFGVVKLVPGLQSVNGDGKEIFYLDAKSLTGSILLASE
jgi:hypothetical protein